MEISYVKPGSIASELGLAPGDRIMEINGSQVKDIIDYKFLSGEEKLTLKILEAGKKKLVYQIENDYRETLGIEFKESGLEKVIRCQNKCIFCFVDQMPPGLRETLYIKDDDYRLSFWDGNFITLTNLTDKELGRIIQQRLSPLYISVHTTNPELRCKMLGNKNAGKIFEQLTLLAKAGIKMNTQLVLCPGINDGIELEKTIKDLSSLWPAVSSIAVVPVGITVFRKGLSPLRNFNKIEIVQLIAQLKYWQDYFLKKFKHPLIFIADELYLRSGLSVPPRRHYADFPQAENGIGLVRLFLDKWAILKRHLPESVTTPRLVTLVTGVLGNLVIKPVVTILNQIKGLTVELEVVVNRFFGETVTATGLLTGSDLKNSLSGKKLGDWLVIPSVMLKEGKEIFLDDLTVDRLSKILGLPVVVAEGPEGLIKAVLTGECYKSLRVGVIMHCPDQL